ncbi:MAG: hypothetical protein LBQ07_00975 [Endomicrobium sp.]|jgi:3-deoxy-D-manno-octulosonic-acid transferase|nr:hypothetical protein [Endomicrobium sp.]
MLKIYLIIYNLVIIIFSPIIVFFIIFFASGKKKEFLYKFLERFGIYNLKYKNSSKKTLWIHCASIGEVRAVESILDSFNDYYIILTLVTKSAREYAEKKLHKANFIAFLPIDFYPIMRKAFNTFNPIMLILVETEFWPSMLYIASHKNIKIITINGRISKKSFKIYKKLSFFWIRFIRLINVIIAKSEDDANRFRFLTNKNNEIVISGNIKYNKNITLNIKRCDYSLRKNDFVFVAGSTRKGEDEIIIDIYNEMSKKFDFIKFFLAPRHLSRISIISKVLKRKKIKFSFFSSKIFDNNFILVDIFGELQNIYFVSDVCYIGGSMVEKGGQNPIEPAAYGKPVLFGKNMYNFKVEAENLIKNGGGLIVKNSRDLFCKISEFILNKRLVLDIGQNALKTVKSQKDFVDFTIKKIKENLKNVQ